MFDVLTLNILEINLFFFLWSFSHHILLATVNIVTLSSFVSSICCLIWISFRILRWCIIVIALPSRISLVFLLFFGFLFVLFNLVLIHFYVISTILGRNVRISRLFSSVVKRCFLFNWLFLIFELLLSLIVEINLFIFFWRFTFLFFVAWHEVICFYVSVVVLYFTGYFCVVDAFKVLLNCLFTVFCV